MGNTRTTAVAMLAASALILAGCGGDAGEPAVETVTETAAPTAEVTDDRARADERPSTDERAAPVAGEDPVFAAIDAVLAAHPGAVVVDVDRHDGEGFDVDAVVGDQVLELVVDPEGRVHETERESDDDDVAKAGAATVTASDAIRQALDQHPDGVLDEIELDEDDGVLRWEIELDDADRNDLVELKLPAT